MDGQKPASKRPSPCHLPCKPSRPPLDTPSPSCPSPNAYCPVSAISPALPLHPRPTQSPRLLTILSCRRYVEEQRVAKLHAAQRTPASPSSSWRTRGGKVTPREQPQLRAHQMGAGARHMGGAEHALAWRSNPAAPNSAYIGRGAVRRVKDFRRSHGSPHLTAQHDGMSGPLRTPSIRRNHRLHSKGRERKEALQQGICRTHSGCLRGGTVGCLGACGHGCDRSPSICANDGWVSMLLIRPPAQPIADGLAPLSVTAGFAAILCSLSTGQETPTPAHD